MPISVAYILSIIGAIAVTILAAIFIMPGSKRASLNGFGKFLHDLCNFKFLIIEKILKFIYILATSFAILQGFFMLFSGYSSWYGGYRSYAGTGILVMLLGPIAIRIVYEFLMMAILLVKNTIEINAKIKAPENSGAVKDVFGASGVNPYATPKKTCKNCGAVLKAGAAFCPRCGANLNSDQQ